MTRRSGKLSPAAAIAARTRAALSRTAASGSPTTSTRGSCELIRTSTSTGTPSTPRSVALVTRDIGLRGTGAGQATAPTRSGLRA